MNHKLKMMATSVAVSLLFGIYACSNNEPTPTPSLPSPSVSTIPSEAVTLDPAPTSIEDEGPYPTEEPEPTRKPPARTTEPTPVPTVTTSEAGTPAVQFAARWGKRYPNVPEFAILKAANATCRLIEASGSNWNDNPATIAAIETAVGAAGLSSKDGVEFAQDANQNYCASVSNPT